jgi:hypothetical protein
MSGRLRNRARGETPALPGAPIAGDAFEAAIESAIMRPADLFDLDGDTLLRYRNGCVEVLDSDALYLALD